MRRGNMLGTIAKYIPFIGMLAVYTISLCRSITLADEIERSINIWTNALVISAILGEIGSLLVIDRFNLLLTGKTPNIVDDIRDERSQDVAVMYNGLIASTFIMTAIMGFYVLYTYTQNSLFLNISTVVATIFAIGTAVYILAAYLKVKNVHPNFVFSKLSNPVFLPVLICMIQLLVTRKNLVGFVYHNICEPQGDMYLIAALIIVLCYFLALAFCHYSNLYCLLGFVFINKDPGIVQRELARLQEQDEKRDEDLRQATKYVDEKAEEVRFIKKFSLIFYFCYIHFKTYIQNRFYSAVYMVSFAKFKITKRFSRLLNPERIRINGIRFCWVATVMELLALDLLLFIYLEGNDPCLKFFELLSTVIIIPVLLSWLAELKAKKE